jgi:hypothetical protein
MSSNPFVGTWRLVSSEIRAATGEVSNPFGDGVTGYLIYSDDGHMAAVIMQRTALILPQRMPRGNSGREGCCY